MTRPAAQPSRGSAATPRRNTGATMAVAPANRQARNASVGRIAIASWTIVNVRPQTAATPTSASSAYGLAPALRGAPAGEVAGLVTHSNVERRGRLHLERLLVLE